jgi:hypothetical protein
LPGIRAEINRLIRDNESQIETLPKQSSGNPRSAVRQLLDNFIADVTVKLVRGDALAKETGLIQLMHVLYAALRLDLQQAALVFRLDDSSEDLPRPDFLPPDELWFSNSPLGNEFTLAEIAHEAHW